MNIIVYGIKGLANELGIGVTVIGRWLKMKEPLPCYMDGLDYQFNLQHVADWLIARGRTRHVKLGEQILEKLKREKD
jgi:hypothetical protein